MTELERAQLCHSTKNESSLNSTKFGLKLSMLSTSYAIQRHRRPHRHTDAFTDYSDYERHLAGSQAIGDDGTIQ